jgi:phage gp36-like protein
MTNTRTSTEDESLITHDIFGCVDIRSSIQESLGDMRMTIWSFLSLFLRPLQILTPTVGNCCLIVADRLL